MEKEKQANEVLKTAGEFAEEILDRAEEKGLTLLEVLQATDTMKNIIKNELRRSGVPYKRVKPAAKTTGQ